MTAWEDGDLHRGDPLRPLAGRLGCSTGQAWTLATGALLGSALLVSSLVRGPGVAQEVAGSSALPPALVQPVTPSATAPAPAPTAAPPPPAPVAPAPVVPAAPVLGLPPVIGLPVVAAPAPVAAPAAPGPTTSTAVAAPATALTISEGGWYARLAAPASQARGFPVTDYPVGADALGDSRHSFVRLSGTARTLVLAVDTGPTATYGAALATVLACATTDPAWKPLPEQPTAPAYSSTGCARGVPSADGATFSFDLSTLPDPTGRAGVTLVADLSTPASGAFQVAFLPRPGATP